MPALTLSYRTGGGCDSDRIGGKERTEGTSFAAAPAAACGMSQILGKRNSIRANISHHTDNCYTCLSHGQLLHVSAHHVDPRIRLGADHEYRPLHHTPSHIHFELGRKCKVKVVRLSSPITSSEELPCRKRMLSRQLHRRDKVALGEYHLPSDTTIGEHLLNESAVGGHQAPTRVDEYKEAFERGCACGKIGFKEEAPFTLERR